jgi:hypothetical protein
MQRLTIEVHTETGVARPRSHTRLFRIEYRLQQWLERVPIRIWGWMMHPLQKNAGNTYIEPDTRPISLRFPPKG